MADNGQVLLVPGTLIAGKYRLVRPVGSGAMGQVWAAFNEKMGGAVALKLIARPDADLRARLQREARACAAIHHPHIIRILDLVETDQNDPVLVMELLRGETLEQRLERKRRLDPPEAALIGRDVARALSAAHAQCIVHRDLKPANIFLHREDESIDFTVKVLDFGVAKDLARVGGDRTVAGSQVGSPSYMSPEQARGEDVDYRADLWSLGVLLFEMLTGRRPFTGERQEVLASVLVAEIPKVGRFVRGIDAGLIEIVSRCMRREREGRPASAGEIADALEVHVLGAGLTGAHARIDALSTETVVNEESPSVVVQQPSAPRPAPSSRGAPPSSRSSTGVEPGGGHMEEAPLLAVQPDPPQLEDAEAITTQFTRTHMASMMSAAPPRPPASRPAVTAFETARTERLNVPAGAWPPPGVLPLPATQKLTPEEARRLSPGPGKPPASPLALVSRTLPLLNGPGPSSSTGPLVQLPLRPRAAGSGQDEQQERHRTRVRRLWIGLLLSAALAVMVGVVVGLATRGNAKPATTPIPEDPDAPPVMDAGIAQLDTSLDASPQVVPSPPASNTPPEDAGLAAPLDESEAVPRDAGIPPPPAKGSSARPPSQAGGGSSSIDCNKLKFLDKLKCLEAQRKGGSRAPNGGH